MINAAIHGTFAAASHDDCERLWDSSPDILCQKFFKLPAGARTSVLEDTAAGNESLCVRQEQALRLVVTGFKQTVFCLRKIRLQGLLCNC